MSGLSNDLLLAITCLKSVGVILTMGSLGFYLQRKGVITKAVKKGMSEVCMQACMPALLFTRILFCEQCGISGIPPDQVPNCHQCESTAEKIGRSTVLLLIPFVMVAVGLLLGFGCQIVSNVQEDFKRGCVAAVTFPNATGMPIVLLTVIFESTKGQGRYPLQDPVQHIPTFLVFYPIFQWGIGSWLFGVGKPSPIDNNAPEEVRVESEQMADFGSAKSMKAVFSMADTIDDADDTEKTHFSNSERRSMELELQDRTAAERSSVSQIPTRNVSTSMQPLRMTTPSSPAPPPPTGILKRTFDFLKQVIQPPIQAIILAMLVGITPLRGLLVDTTYQCRGAFLFFVFQGLEKVGLAAVPINVLVLGATLADSEGLKALPWRVHFCIIFCKMVLMPLIIFLIVQVLRRSINTHMFVEERNAIWLVAMAASALPTANNINTLAQLGQQNTGCLAATICAQYLCAPVLVTMWLLVFIHSSDTV